MQLWWMRKEGLCWGQVESGFKRQKGNWTPSHIHKVTFWNSGESSMYKKAPLGCLNFNNWSFKKRSTLFVLSHSFFHFFFLSWLCTCLVFISFLDSCFTGHSLTLVASCAYGSSSSPSNPWWTKLLPVLLPFEWQQLPNVNLQTTLI